MIMACANPKLVLILWLFAVFVFGMVLGYLAPKVFMLFILLIGRII